MCQYQELFLTSLEPQQWNSWTPPLALSQPKKCKNKGAAVRLYDNTFRCEKGETAVDLDIWWKEEDIVQGKIQNG